ncbi:hypothetical protein N9I74_03100 [Candidatus Pelagibacter sp.]|nr:hypothetical protein [Candidatus Pelagibacter sp.]|tara:strand:+ start:175 stop:393 length:219 start_codon:yes stop_codon:yes gene_type:complete
MKKLLEIMIISLLISGSAYAENFWNNKLFPSDDAKNYCTKKAYGGLNWGSEGRSDETKKMLYKMCIRKWYED